MPTTYTDEQKAEAVELYRTEGMAEAHKTTGVPKPSIKRWADERGVVSERSDEQTRAATEAHVLAMLRKKQQLRTELADKALEMLARMSEPETDHKGQNAKEVTYERATAMACAKFATSAAILIDKLEIVGWAEGEGQRDKAGEDLERLRAEAVARGEHLTAVA